MMWILRMTVWWGALLITTAGQVQADLVWDYSPATTGATLDGPWSNESSGQNFAERIFFANPMSVGGMDIYTKPPWGPDSLGKLATIRLWSDSSGAPDFLLHDFTEIISVVDTEGAGSAADVVRVHVDFASPLLLSANTSYWIGMSGTSAELAQLSLKGTAAPDDSRMYQFSGTTKSHFATVGDMAFRLHDTAEQIVPEPASLAIWGLGALGIGLVARRRHRKPLL